MNDMIQTFTFVTVDDSCEFDVANGLTFRRCSLCRKKKELNKFEFLCFFL